MTCPPLDPLAKQRILLSSRAHWPALAGQALGTLMARPPDVTGNRDAVHPAGPARGTSGSDPADSAEERLICKGDHKGQGLDGAWLLSIADEVNAQHGRGAPSI